MVKIALGPYWDGAGSPPEEYFLLAYHAGTGLDAQDPDGDQTDDPMVPSQGLAIWHCIGGYAGTGTTSFFDLESAMGLWNYGTPNYVPYLIPPTAADMAVNYPNFVADPVNGYDNYDLWRVVPNPTPGEGSHYRAGYGDYWGDEFDFFRSDLSGTVVYYDNNEVPHTIDLADYNNDKFTFVSNPNTYGYSTNATPGVPARRRPQDVPNSIVVHIGEKVSDPYEGDYLTIDYSPGPWGKILVPAESQHLTPGTPIDITWSDEYEPYIDAVDIYYTRDFTTGAWEPLVVGQPIDMVSSWEWTPTVAQATAQRSSSQLRIDFHNTVSDAVATEYSSCFLVDGEDVHAEDIVYPTIGTALYAGATVDLRWTAMYDGEENWSDFRLHWRHEATSDEGYVDLNWSFLPGEGVFRASWTPSELQAWPDVELRMECTNELDEISYGPWSPFLKVYPTGAGFTDKTLDCGVPASNWYSGEPSSSVSMDFDGDDDEDIVISMMEDSQGRGVVAYRNWSSLAGVMALQYVLDTAVFDSPERPQEGATHVASGDLNRDGLRDIVVGMADAVGAKIYKSTGGTPIFDDVTTTYFAPGSLAARENKVYASFVDANHDGYEDVLMASANGGLDQNHFDALFLCRFENQVPQLEESDAWPVFGSGSTVAWADRDQNGYWDVFCGSASGGKILVENSSGGFTDMTNTLPFPIYGVRGACWLDFDHADGLDLAISTTAQGIVVLYGTENPVIPFSGEYLQLDYPEGWQPGGLSAIDYDLNTWADLVLSGASDDATPMLLLNLGDRAEYGERFVDVGTAIGLGLGVSEASNSLAPADYDGDHDIDLMIPRLVDVQVGGENVGGRVYQNQARTGSSAETNWIAFDFESAGSFLGVSSLGTIITLSSEDPVLGQSVSLGRAVLDGGRGFGGQGSGLVVMGLGDFDGTVHFRLHLPNVSVLGTAQPGTIVDVGQMDALQQLSRELDPDLTIEAGSVKRSISVQPDTDLLDWHFTWKTNVWSPKENDIVHLSGSGCAFGSPDLDVNYSDVEVTVTYSFDAETGESTYVHELIWYDQPCLVGCSYSFSVESSTDGPSAITSTASGASGIIKVCPQSY